MANYVFTTVVQRASCAWNGNQYHRRRLLQQFSATDPLDFVAVYILGPLPKSSQDNQHELLMTHEYSELTGAILTPETNLTQIANLFLNHWKIPFRISIYLHTDNGLQFVCMFFVFVWSISEWSFSPQQRIAHGRTSRSCGLTERLGCESDTEDRTISRTETYSRSHSLTRTTRTYTVRRIVCHTASLLWRQPPGTSLLIDKTDKKPSATDIHSTQSM